MLFAIVDMLMYIISITYTLHDITLAKRDLHTAALTPWIQLRGEVLVALPTSDEKLPYTRLHNKQGENIFAELAHRP